MPISCLKRNYNVSKNPLICLRDASCHERTKEDLHLIIKRVWSRNNGGELKHVDRFLEKPGIEGTLIVQSKKWR